MGPSRYERVVELGSRCLLLAVMDIILSQRLGVPRTFTSNNYYYGILLYALWCLVNVSVFLVVAVLIVKPTRQLVDSLSFVVLTVVLGLSYAINEPLLQDSRGHVTGSGQRPEVKVVWLDDVVVTVVVQVALASVYVFVRGRVGWRAAWQADGQLWPAAWCVLFCLPAVLQLCSPPVPLPAAVGWLPTVCASLAHGELLVVLLLQIPRIVDSLEWQLRRLLQLLCNPRRLQLVVHGQWSRLRVPTVLGTYWALRLLADLVLVVARERGVLVQQDDEPASESAGLHPVVTFYDMDVADDKVSLYFRAPGTWTNQTDPAGRSAIGSLAWSTARSVLLRGCDGILPLVGMTTVVSAVGRHVGRLLTVFLDVDDGDAGSSLGTMCGVLFFVLALQTGLTRLAPHRRLVRLARNLCLLGTAVLHFAHGLVHPMLLVTGASPAAPTARHARPLVVCALLLVASPIGLLVALWSWHAGANPWLLAVTVFSLEVLLKVTISLLTYGLLLYDARCQSTWERLDDYIYYLEAVGNGVEFLFGVFLFGNGTWILVFESQGGAGSLIRVCMMSIHAYYNIYWAACECWRALARRRAASAKIDALPAASSEQLAQLDDICSICHGQLTSAVVTTCGHFFHGICLRKWLYQHDRCPLCHQPVGGTTGMQQQKQQQQQQRRQQRQEQPEQQPQQQPGQQQQEQPEQQRLQQPEQQPQQQPEQQRLQQPEQQPQQQPELQQQEQPEQQQQEQPEQQPQEQPEAWWPAVDDVIHPHLD